MKKPLDKFGKVCYNKARKREREVLKMKSYYIVKMNGSYMNSFKSYKQACELRDQLQRRWRNATIEIEIAYE